MTFCEKFYAKKNGGYNLCTSILVSHINRMFNFIVPIIIHFSDSSTFVSSLITPFSGVIWQLDEKHFSGSSLFVVIKKDRQWNLYLCYFLAVWSWASHMPCLSELIFSCIKWRHENLERHVFSENGMLRLDALFFSPWFLLVLHFSSESSRCACSYVMFWYRSDGLAWIKAMARTQGGWSSAYAGFPEGEAHARFPLLSQVLFSVSGIDKPVPCSAWPAVRA